MDNATRYLGPTGFDPIMNKIAANPVTITTRTTISSRAPCGPRQYRASVMGEPSGVVSVSVIATAVVPPPDPSVTDVGPDSATIGPSFTEAISRLPR